MILAARSPSSLLIACSGKIDHRTPHFIPYGTRHPRFWARLPAPVEPGRVFFLCHTGRRPGDCLRLVELDPDVDGPVGASRSETTSASVPGTMTAGMMAGPRQRLTD